MGRGVGVFFPPGSRTGRQRYAESVCNVYADVEAHTNNRSRSGERRGTITTGGVGEQVEHSTELGNTACGDVISRRLRGGRTVRVMKRSGHFHGPYRACAFRKRLQPFIWILGHCKNRISLGVGDAYRRTTSRRSRARVIFYRDGSRVGDLSTRRPIAIRSLASSSVEADVIEQSAAKALPSNRSAAVSAHR